MRTFVRGVLVAGVLTASAGADVAWAQATTPAVPTRDTVQPSVRATVVYDDNVFAQPNQRGDMVVRVSPFLSATKADPKRTITASYGFDAERYDTYSELTAIQARANALATVSFRPTPKRHFDINGGYTQTNNPTELNT